MSIEPLAAPAGAAVPPAGAAATGAAAARTNSAPHAAQSGLVCETLGDTAPLTDLPYIAAAAAAAAAP